MGLDMYLTAEKHFSKYSGDQEEFAKLKPFTEHLYDNLETIELSWEIGYWRKANQIHNWFVQNCQGGVDECQRTWVSEEKLQELLDICGKIIKIAKLSKGIVCNGAILEAGKTEFEPILEDGEIIENAHEIEKLLPTKSGFFFGSCNYDEYYFRDIQNTVKILINALDLSKKGCSIYYQSSW